MNTIYGNESKELLADRYTPEELQNFAFVLTGLQFVVRNVSLWKINQPWQVPLRQINDTLIWLVKEGCFKVHSGNREFHLSSGEGVIVPAYIPHSFEFAAGCSAGRTFIIHADIFPCSGRDFADCLLTGKFTLQDKNHLFQLLERAVAIRNFNRNTAMLYTRNPIQELLLECAANKMFRTDIAHIEDIRIRCAMDYFRSNYMNNISVADAAAASGLGEVQFRNLFRRHSGTSPAVYLKNLRLRRAAELLAGTLLPIKDIARDSGFNSESYFCLVFRKYYGISPELYRKKSFSL